MSHFSIVEKVINEWAIEPEVVNYVAGTELPTRHLSVSRENFPSEIPLDQEPAAKIARIDIEEINSDQFSPPQLVIEEEDKDNSPLTQNSSASPSTGELRPNIATSSKGKSCITPSGRIIKAKNSSLSINTQPLPSVTIFSTNPLVHQIVPSIPRPVPKVHLLEVHLAGVRYSVAAGKKPFISGPKLVYPVSTSPDYSVIPIACPVWAFRDSKKPHIPAIDVSGQNFINDKYLLPPVIFDPSFHGSNATSIVPIRPRIDNLTGFRPVLPFYVLDLDKMLQQSRKLDRAILGKSALRALVKMLSANFWVHETVELATITVESLRTILYCCALSNQFLLTYCGSLQDSRNVNELRNTNPSGLLYNVSALVKSKFNIHSNLLLNQLNTLQIYVNGELNLAFILCFVFLYPLFREFIMLLV